MVTGIKFNKVQTDIVTWLIDFDVFVSLCNWFLTKFDSESRAADFLNEILHFF